jgi:penicillin-binding protein 2
VGIRPMDVPAGQMPTLVRDLAAVLKMPAAKIQSKLDRQRLIGLPYDLVIVKEDVKAKVVSYLLEHDLTYPGVEIQKDYLRDYPQGRMAAQILGNMGEITKEQLKEQHFKGYSAGDMVGQQGLEWTYDRWLRGRDGVAKVEVDAMGRPKANAPVPGGRLPQPGDTLVTTIDAGVQAKTEEALAKGIDLTHNNENHPTTPPAAVVLDAHSGQVIAMASYPTYDPKVYVGGLSVKDAKRLYARSSNYPLLSRATQESVAVGSTFKVVDSIAGLEEGVITPSSTFYCNGAFVPPNLLHRYVFHCWLPSGHGSLSLIPAIAQSCDVYFYNVGYKFYLRQGTELEDWARRLGMGKPTGIDIPGEVAGRVPTPRWKRQHYKTEVDQQWTPGDSILLAIGQGNMEATPLQLATTYAAIANGGTIVKPHLGLKVVDSQGHLVQNLAPTGAHKVEIAQSTLDALRAGLREAATSGTSAPTFAGYPIAVAGKTGTAQVYGKQDFAWYASYAPANDPKYVVVVMIEQGGHGGTVAAPVARMIYDQLFHQKSSSTAGSTVTD